MGLGDFDRIGLLALGGATNRTSAATTTRRSTWSGLHLRCCASHMGSGAEQQQVVCKAVISPSLVMFGVPSGQSVVTRCASTESSVWTRRATAGVSAVLTVPSLPSDAHRTLGAWVTALCLAADMAYVTWAQGPVPAFEAM